MRLRQQDACRRSVEAEAQLQLRTSYHEYLPKRLDPQTGAPVFPLAFPLSGRAK
jgi:hypothetical protein